MRSYQSVLILKPDLDDTLVEKAAEKVDGYFKKYGGETLSVENWGKKRLAYRVRKNRFGIYLNIYHTCENEKLDELEKEYSLNENIIKFMVIRLTDKELERALARIAEAGKPAEEGEESDSDDDDKKDDKEAKKETVKEGSDDS
ncbi:MAG: 30S ribosomal protein S6 [Candidatus Nitrohelix vancouverensis]|uniref:Small ribosomal subunit protein bS6 n=1 Tax=Candidatus Nitrohelix vancouverensis TaxID=2705534 RepID=A0A7T0G469_9BACT|nr:MAG: 30S ribosomal protein S6 [Candidatus Nitrohelix vancouverensis]